MNPSNSGSFIPKKTPGKPRSALNRGQIIGVFGYTSYALFFGAIILSAGMFGLSYYVQDNVINQQETLLLIQNQIDANEITDLVSHDHYLRSVEKVFGHSFSVLPLLRTFEEIIAEPVFLTTLEMKRGEKLDVRIEGVADSFDSTLFQRETVLQQILLSSAKVTEVNLVRDGGTVIRPASAGTPVSSNIAQFIAGAAGTQLVTFVLEASLPMAELPFTVADRNGPQRVTNLEAGGSSVVVPGAAGDAFEGSDGVTESDVTADELAPSLD